MTKKKAPIEKPVGFDLSRYKAIEDLTPIDWYYEILLRKIALDALENDDMVSFWANLGEIRVGPYPLIEKNRLITKPLKPEPKTWINKGLKTNAVRLTTLGDLDRTNQNINTAHEKENQPAKNKFSKQYMPVDIRLHDATGISPHQINLSVNLLATNPILKEDFEKIIDAARKHFGISSDKVASNDKINTWIKHRVLQHMDIHLWCKLNDEPDIKPSILANWIHPENDPPRSPTQRSRDAKLGRTEALKLLDDEFLQRFEAELLSGESAEAIESQKRKLKVKKSQN